MKWPRIFTIWFETVAHLVTQRASVVISQRLRNIENRSMKPGYWIFWATVVASAHFNSCEECNNLELINILLDKQSLTSSGNQWLFDFNKISFIWITDTRKLLNCIRDTWVIYIFVSLIAKNENLPFPTSRGALASSWREGLNIPESNARFDTLQHNSWWLGDDESIFILPTKAVRRSG